MRPGLFIGIMLVILIIPGFISLLFPPEIASVYASFMHPFGLLMGCIFGFQAAQAYRKELRQVFLFLSLFLGIYTIANLSFMWEMIGPSLGNWLPPIVIALQVCTYIALLISSSNVLRVMDVKRVSKLGWLAIALMFLLCLYIVISRLPEISQSSGMQAAFALAITIIDMAVILMLLPVIPLYIHHMNSRQEESMTFTLVMGGIIFSLLSTYIYQLALGVPMYVVAGQYYHTGSLLDCLYIYGYSVVAVGLYAHRKHTEWSFSVIEKVLSGKRAWT